jgi:hypothetical protein
MTTMFKRSWQHITPQQSRRLAKLMYECEDMFAKDELYLVFSIVKLSTRSTLAIHIQFDRK